MCYVYRGKSDTISSICFEVLQQRKKIKEMWKNVNTIGIWIMAMWFAHLIIQRTFENFPRKLS